MAGLKSQPEYSTPAFEPMDDSLTTATTDATTTTTTTTTTTKEQTMNTTTNTQDAGAAATSQATTAIAAASATSALAVAKPATKFYVAFADKNGVLDTTTVEGLSMSAPALKGEQGSVFKGDKELGGMVHLEMISFNHRWAIGTGTDDKEAKDFYRVSYDNKTLSGSGADMAAYVESLKAEGFNKAKVSPYLDVWGFLVWSEKDGEIPVDEREIVRLQCSQTSLGAFTAFATTRGLLESRGMAQPIDIIGVKAEKRVKGTNKYTNFSFFAPKAK